LDDSVGADGFRQLLKALRLEDGPGL